jgi:hypothetical protein
MTLNAPLNTTPLGRPPAGLYKVTAAETPDGKERIRAYYEALGRFATMYARAESSAHAALCRCAKTDGAISAALFSGVRVRQAGDFIRRIMEATAVAQDAIDEFVEYRDQLYAITTVRDAILHLGAQSVAEGEGFVSDTLRAHLPAKVRTFPISPKILDDMTEDLRKIGLYLLTRHAQRSIKSTANQRQVKALLAAPWRYTRPSASQPKPRKRGT